MTTATPTLSTANLRNLRLLKTAFASLGRTKFQPNSSNSVLRAILGTDRAAFRKAGLEVTKDNEVSNAYRLNHRRSLGAATTVASWVGLDYYDVEQFFWVKRPTTGRALASRIERLLAKYEVSGEFQS